MEGTHTPSSDKSKCNILVSEINVRLFANWVIDNGLLNLFNGGLKNNDSINCNKLKPLLIITTKCTKDMCSKERLSEL